jgi:hypothetical protein
LKVTPTNGRYSPPVRATPTPANPRSTPVAKTARCWPPAAHQRPPLLGSLTMSAAPANDDRRVQGQRPQSTKRSAPPVLTQRAVARRVAGRGRRSGPVADSSEDGRVLAH